MTIREQYAIPKKYNTLSLALMAIGLLSIIILFITHGSKGGEENAAVRARFWASLLQNSVYFLLITNAAMFFICATTLMWGGWQMAFRRVTEAISACVPILSIITFIILLVLVFGGDHAIYHWTDTEHVKHDPILLGKSGFLNKTFFTVWTLITLVGWSWLGMKMRSMSRSLDERRPDLEERKRYVWNNTVWSGAYMILFGLTVMSSIPWLWLMSIDAHWYSTM